MTKTLSLPRLPAIPARSLVRPMLLAALGLHAVVLFVPFPKAREKPPETKEAPVKITQLPTAKSSPNTKIAPKVSTPPAKPALPRINRAIDNPVIARPDAPKSIEQPQPSKPIAPANTANSPAKDAGSSANSSDLIKDFPIYPGAQQNCFEQNLPFCYVASADLTTVDAFYQKETAAKKIKLDPVASDATKKIYKVSRGAEAYYLSLFADQPTTVINLSKELIDSLYQLKKVVSVPPEYSLALQSALGDGLGRGDGDFSAKPERFDHPNLFFSSLGGTDEKGFEINAEPRQGVDAMLVTLQGTPDTVYNSLKSELASKQFQVQPVGQYGGGNVYLVKKGSTSLYLNLVPVKGQAGAIAVTWTIDPTKG